MYFPVARFVRIILKRLMLAVCLDKSEVVVTRLAVHVMISHNCLCMIYIALMFLLNN